MTTFAKISTELNKQLPEGTSYFCKYIKLRIASNKNFLCAITGQTGSSKSYSAMSLMEIINSDKNPEELIKNICLTTRQFVERVNSGDLKAGDVIIWDEAGIGMNSKSWASIANKIINLILQTFRNMNLIIFFTLPHLSFLDSDSRKLLHSTIQTLKVDRSEKSATLKPLIIQVNQDTGKLYKKYLRVRGRNGKLAPVKRLKVYLASPKLLELYEAKKKQFTHNLNRDIMNKLIAEEEKTRVKELNKPKDLTPSQSMAVELWETHKNYRNIAEIMKISEASAYYHVHQAKKRLKEQKEASERQKRAFSP